MLVLSFKSLIESVRSRRWCALFAAALAMSVSAAHAEVRIWNLRVNASSGAYPGYEEQSAIDQNFGTFWTPGRTADPSSPAFIEIDLQKLAKVRRIRMTVAQTPTGYTDHQFYGRGADGSWLILYAQQVGTTWDGQVFDITSSSDIQVRYILIHTAQSSGWVAWREIEVYEADPPPPPGPPTLSNSGNIPILLYHSHHQPGCGITDNANRALASDLELLKSDGWTVIPLAWATQWILGQRDGSTLPAKSIAITFDDGPMTDWYSYNHPACGWVSSAYQVLQNFKFAHPDLPWYSPHGSAFVIGAPMARQALTQGGMIVSDEWWASAQASGLMSIYNHSADHDSIAITSPVWDGAMGTYLPVGYLEDKVPNGIGNFLRINNEAEADVEVMASASYISSKIGAWPDLFAYPYGRYDNYLRYDYFPNRGMKHITTAAFCLDHRAARRGDDRYCIPRLGFADDWLNPNVPNSPPTVLELLRRLPQ